MNLSILRFRIADAFRKAFGPRKHGVIICVLTVCIAVSVIVWIYSVMGRLQKEWQLRAAGADHKSVVSRLLVIRIALNTYSEVMGCLPAAVVRNNDGTPIYSWRVALGTLVEEAHREGWRHFAKDEHWQSPANKILREHGGSMGFGYKGESSAKFLAVTGSGTAFEDGKCRKLDEMPKGLIVIVEKSDSSFFWMEPGDVELESLRGLSYMTCGEQFARSRSSFHVLLASGEIWELTRDTPLSVFIECASADTANSKAVENLSHYRLQ